ncbi:hypothetical protein Tco_1074744 [Tanacetum coccineum]
MLVQGLIFQGEGSTVPVESHHTPTSAPSTSHPSTSPPSMQTTHVVEEAATMPHDSPLPRVHSLRSDEGSEEVYIDEPYISTANVPVSTAGAEVSTISPEVKTAAESLMYNRRSATKRKYKGKAIMKEAEPVHKKIKLQVEQERLGYEEALRLQEQLDEEERQRIKLRFLAFSLNHSPKKGASFAN